MTAKTDERVLVIPTPVFHEAGLFQGFCPRVDYYLPHLLNPENLSYRPRSEVETDPGFKQIIPYVVLRWKGEAFHYTRGKGVSETRLQALRSLGIGGHISEGDNTLFGDSYRIGMLREVDEEVNLDSTYQEKCIGLINDDSTPVGQVHLGVIHVFDLAEPRVRRREQALARSGFALLTELRTLSGEFETWSQFLLADGLLD
jgi:predicted NUDIX family phosphoesterase